MNKKNEIIEKIINQSLDTIMSQGFSRYSKYIIQQRAIPDARDGLKPVQRRILFSMFQMNLTHEKPFKKSARVVGEVIGKYHPHGDSSIYEALIRMSQEWKMSLPVVEMHGNKGSIDDDPAAAMRYTETRLEKISTLLLGHIDKKIVSFVPNFDDSEYEPTVLPTLFPNLLANGAKGIAEGYATDIAPHNLNELLDASIEIIKNPHISSTKLLEIIKGPDFPTGAIISDIDGFKEAFETGKGKISIYSKIDFIKNKNDQIIALEVKEIPYGVIKIELVKQIQNLIINKTIDGIKEVRDQSNRQGVSIYIELENDTNAKAILDFLYQKTDLKIYYNYNMVAISDNAPKLLGIKQLLEIYLQHLRKCEQLSLQYDFEKLSKKLEIILGFIKISEISDQVIEVIKNSDNSKKGVIENLIKEFKFSEIQATAIAELRLYRLSKMDQKQYLEDKINLEAEIARIANLLNNEEQFKTYLINLLLDIKKTYGIKRRSEISIKNIEININEKDLVKSEDFWCYVTVDGYIKKISQKIYLANELSTFGIKENDILQYVSNINSHSKLLFFTSQGNYFILDAFSLKDSTWKDLGNHISDYVKLFDNEKIIQVFNLENLSLNILFLIVSKYGLAKKIRLLDFIQTSNRKFNCMKIKLNDEIIAIKISQHDKKVIFVLNDGLYHFFDETQIPIYSLKASGITAIKLFENSINKIELLNDEDELIIANDRGQFKKIAAKNIKEVKRQNVAKVLYWPLKNTPFSVLDVYKFQKNLEFYYLDNDNKINIYNTNNIAISNVQENFSNPKININKLGRFINNKNIYENSQEFLYNNFDSEQLTIPEEPLQYDDQTVLFEENVTLNSEETIKKAEWLDVDELINSALKKVK
ncbi:DNA topoisomerase (ATP-hydrolyzing) [Mycoplasma miroungirhinis]|uniref:DNA topoisomerase 4 subunit A n=1 Tax=Mycoplasma miroungirhinis TaxID=754516 RepID=A0A6M4JI27_9MOLU|nr:DNA topoisomerase (ATP-hydrolyzing) [Mycoplasma miroungirhinis]QJR44101.1 DNA topoisomerase 4 subunit A [Mycoplasma miroungirhinis]